METNKKHNITVFFENRDTIEYNNVKNLNFDIKTNVLTFTSCETNKEYIFTRIAGISKINVALKSIS